MAATKDLPAFVDFGRNQAPIYLQVASVFRRYITSGQWQVGDRLPTHDALAIQLDVNPATVRKAIGVLGEEGLLAPYRRHGTFVTARPADEAWLDIPTQGREIFTVYDGLESDWISGRVTRAVEWPLLEGAKPASSYYRIDRLYKREARPVVLEESYLSDDVKRELGLRQLKRGPILRLLDEGSLAHRVEQRIRFGVADQTLARRLELELNAPLAIMELWVLDRSNTVIHFATAHYRGDIVRIQEAIAPPKSEVRRRGKQSNAR